MLPTSGSCVYGVRRPRSMPRRGEAKIRSRWAYVVVFSIVDSSDPQPFRAFQTIDGSAPTAASSTVIHTWRSHDGCFHSVHATTPTATGRTWALCHSASPSTSPKTPARTRLGRSTSRRPASSSRAE